MKLSEDDKELLLFPVKFALFLSYALTVSGFILTIVCYPFFYLLCALTPR